MKDPRPFRFKQFEVHHHLSTFKVNTDGVLIGCHAHIDQYNTALDIGTGSGIIPLILAQRSQKLHITGIEKDQVSANQARYNGENSIFSDRISIVNSDCFSYDYPTKYGLIICNPPYFKNSTLPKLSTLSQAKHSNDNFIIRLIKLTESQLCQRGTLQFLYPYTQDYYVKSIIEDSVLNLSHKTVLKSYLDSKPYACIYTLTYNPTAHHLQESGEDQIVLYESKGIYTDAYKKLTNDFYLWNK